jgi:hypothetical protein
MGCGACRVIFEENRDSPLDWNLTKLQENPYIKESKIAILNSDYEKAQKIIEIVEDIRVTIFDNLDELILKTGACVFNQPDIVTCIKTVLWKVSTDNWGNIKASNINFYEDDPYITIKSGRVSNETTLLINYLINYISNLFSLRNQLKEIDLKIPQLIYIITENNEKNLFTNNREEFVDDEIIKNNNNMTSLNKIQKQIINTVTNNNRKIRKTINLFPDLINDYNNIIEKIKFEFMLIKKDLDYLINIDKVGSYAHEKHISDVYEIAFASRKILIKKKSVEEEDDIYPEKENYTNIYVKSISDGKNNYERIIESKKYLKNKRLVL